MEFFLTDIGFMIGVATVLAHVSRLMKQPHIPAYILAGILIGPSGLELITNPDVITTFSELGIVFLLFIVGLELDLTKVKDVGVKAAVVALAAAAAVFTVALLSAHYLGFTDTESLYIGLALTFSSTMVVVRLLSDEGALDSVHGQLTLGVLMVQDILVVVALGLTASIGRFSVEGVVNSLGVAVAAFAVAAVASREIINRLYPAQHTDELMLLTSLSFLFLFLGISEAVGFSPSIGAFIAGIATSTCPCHYGVMQKVRGLRDFFSILFFVALGMGVMLSGLLEVVVPFAAFLIVAMVFKPAVIALASRMVGFTREVSFRSGLSLLQVSEFSLVIIMQGLVLGHIGDTVFSIVTALALVTIAATSYVLRYDRRIWLMINRGAD